MALALAAVLGVTAWTGGLSPTPSTTSGSSSASQEETLQTSALAERDATGFGGPEDAGPPDAARRPSSPADAAPVQVDASAPRSSLTEAATARRRKQRSCTGLSIDEVVVETSRGRYPILAVQLRNPRPRIAGIHRVRLEIMSFEPLASPQEPMVQLPIHLSKKLNKFSVRETVAKEATATLIFPISAEGKYQEALIRSKISLLYNGSCETNRFPIRPFKTIKGS